MCPCESADRWTDWQARYAYEPDSTESTKLEWQGNFCEQCGRSVTDKSVGAYVAHEG